MRASTIPVAITLTLAPLPALPFDQDEFCVAVTDIAHRMNVRKGRWLECIYEDDLEPMLLENRRDLIQVTGRVIPDDDGHYGILATYHAVP